MKKLRLIIFIVAFSAALSAQFNEPRANEAIIGGGFGVTWIDNQPFYSFRFFPEIGFANFGVGLDLNLQISPEGKLRKENFNEFSDYLSIIRYVRYGQKRDPVYARLGALDYATLGHGTIMYLYNNSPSFDARKTGLEFDVDFSQFGFESIYSNFGQAGIIGIRGYVRPLKFTTAGSIPVIGGIELGATFAGDFNENAGVVSGSYLQQEDKFKVTDDKGSLDIIGFDIGLPVLRASVLNLDLYYDVNKIINFGSGSALGAIFDFHGLGLVDVRAKFERRFNGDGYLPSYFNALYEIERFKLNKSTGELSSKIQILNSNFHSGDGFYGELLVSVVNTFHVLGSYQRLDDYPQSGILHLSTDISPEGSSYVLRAGYDKTGIIDEKDLFKLDDRSYLFVETGYKPLPYIIVSIVYNWTFTPERDADDNITGYKPQKKIEPRISFVYPFDI